MHTTVAIKQALHTPTVNLPPSHTTQRHSKPSGYTAAHPSCQTGQTSQTQAPRPRTPHTAVAIKKALHTPPAHLRPSQTRQRHRKPSGYTAAPPSCQTGQTGQTGQTQAPRPRNTHTTVVIKKARHTPSVNLHPNPYHTAALQTLGLSRGLPRRSPSGRRRAHQSLFYKSYKSYKSYASTTPP